MVSSPAVVGDSILAELSAGACDPLDELDRLPVRDIDGRQELKTWS